MNHLYNKEGSIAYTGYIVYNIKLMFMVYTFLLGFHGTANFLAFFWGEGGWVRGYSLRIFPLSDYIYVIQEM